MKNTTPYNEDAEKAILASLILDGGAESMSAIRAKGITSTHFFSVAHQIIFDACLSLTANGKPCDEITVPAHLNASRELASVGGIQYINEITDSIEVAAHLPTWCDLVCEAYTRRRLITLATGLLDRARDPSVSPDACLDRASLELFDLSGTAQPIEDPRQTLDDLERRFEDAVSGTAQDESEDDKVSWGFPELDRRFRPLCARNGDFLVGISGEAGTGKSSFVDCLISSAVKAGKVVVKHALETSNAATMQSIAALNGGLPVNAADDAAEIRRFAASQFDRGTRAISAQRNAYAELRRCLGRTLFLHDHTQEFSDIVTWTRRDAAIAQKAGKKLDLVVVDYLAEITLTQKDKMRSDEVLDLIARRLKALAKQLRCPIILILSLNRAQNGAKPTMQSIRGSGGVGFILDRAIALWRPEEVNGQPNKCTDQNPSVEVWAEQFPKRNCPAWSERLIFTGAQKRFSEPVRR